MTMDSVRALLLTLGLLGGIGAGMPTVVAAVVQTRWASWVKQVTALVLSAAAGLLTVWLNGDLTGVTWLPAVVLVIAAAETTYRLYWRKSAVGKALERWAPWVRLLDLLLRRQVPTIDGEGGSSTRETQG